MELEGLLPEQHRAHDELSLMQQCARGRADDRVTLSADLETTDLLTTAIRPPTLTAAELWRLRNDVKDFFGTRRDQLIRSAEFALYPLARWDLLVVDKPAGAKSRSDKSTEQVLAETTRPCPLLRTHASGKEVRAHDVRQSPPSARILLALPP